MDLRGFIARAVLRANVIGRGQAHLASIPERGMVSGMIVRIAAEDIEHQTAIEFMQRLLWTRESCANNLREFLITGIPSLDIAQPNNVRAETMLLRSYPNATRYDQNAQSAERLCLRL